MSSARRVTPGGGRRLGRSGGRGGAVATLAPLLVLAAVAAGVLSIGAGRHSHETLDAEVLHVAGEVRCPVCAGETAAQSDAAASVQIRNEIRSELQAGQSPARILAGLVGDYGSGILEQPRATGIGFVVWAAPAAAFVVAGGALGAVFIRWRRRDPARPGMSAPRETADVPEHAAHGSAPLVEAPLVEAPRVGARLVEAPRVGARLVEAPPDCAASADAAPAHLPRAELTPAASAGTPAGPGSAVVARRRRLALSSAGLVALAACGAGWAVAASSGPRLPGGTATGSPTATETVSAALQRAQSDINRGDDLDAVKEFQSVIDNDPDDVDALTGEGWLLAQTQQPALLQRGLSMLGAAERADPGYPPAHVYRGIAFLSEGDDADAVPELRWYLGHGPEPSLAPRVRVALEEAQEGLAHSR